VSQFVVDGGVERTLLGEEINDDEHSHSTEIDIKLDTDRLGWWPGGVFRILGEGRTGESVHNRARAATNYDSLFPAVPNASGDDVIAFNEITLTQFFSETFGVFGGLIDAAYGDQNDFAGDGRSNDYFLNMNFNSNPVGLASTPDVTLGGGGIWIPNDKYQLFFGAYNAEATANLNPFEHDEGTTFFTQGSRKHAIGGKGGKQTLGFLYGIDKDRADLFVDGRFALESLLVNNTFPTTDKDTWAVTYSLQQYIHGDAEQGWGVFMRAGISDGDPNPIEHYVAAGVGGNGVFKSRPKDRFGIGAYWSDFSDDGLLAAIDINDSYGYELFYNFEVIPGLNITPDIQFIESPLPRVEDTTIVAGIRTKWDY
jgi:porin